MDIIHTMVLDHHFHTHLTPGGHSYYVPNIPFLRMLHDLIEFLIPVFDRCNMTTRFIKTLEPEWALFCQDTTEVAGIPTGFPFLKIRCPPDHKEPFRHRIAWKLFVIEQGDKLAEIVNGITAQHIPGYGNILT